MFIPKLSVIDPLDVWPATAEEKLLESILGSARPVDCRPTSYLVGRAGEMIPCIRSAHQTEILKNPFVRRYIPWATRADAAIQNFYRTLSRESCDYWRRTELTTPLDHEIIDAWYATGGMHLARHKLGQEDPELWELTGTNPKPAEAPLVRWLEFEQPHAEAPRVNVDLTLLPAAVPANANEFPARLLRYVEPI